jgi:hypothetical protein
MLSGLYQPRASEHQHTKDDQHHLPRDGLDELDLHPEELDAGTCDPSNNEDNTKTDEK